jgi:hypothetical protein
MLCTATTFPFFPLFTLTSGLFSTAQERQTTHSTTANETSACSVSRKLSRALQHNQPAPNLYCSRSARNALARVHALTVICAIETCRLAINTSHLFTLPEVNTKYPHFKMKSVRNEKVTTTGGKNQHRSVWIRWQQVIGVGCKRVLCIVWQVRHYAGTRHITAQTICPK